MSRRQWHGSLTGMAINPVGASRVPVLTRRAKRQIEAPGLAKSWRNRLPLTAARRRPRCPDFWIGDADTPIALRANMRGGPNGGVDRPKRLRSSLFRPSRAANPSSRRSMSSITPCCSSFNSTTLRMSSSSRSLRAASRKAQGVSRPANGLPQGQKGGCRWFPPGGVERVYARQIILCLKASRIPFRQVRRPPDLKVGFRFLRVRYPLQ